jgi:hypothetical protein
MAPKSPTTEQDVENAHAVAIAVLDASLFQVQRLSVGNER